MARRKFYFYHKNLKPMMKINYCEDWDKIPNDLIRRGFQKGKNLKQQIEFYNLFIQKIQDIKLYKVKETDQSMYVGCILALYKLKQLDPNDPDTPFYITPKRKVRKLKN